MKPLIDLAGKMKHVAVGMKAARWILFIIASCEGRMKIHIADLKAGRKPHPQLEWYVGFLEPVREHTAFVRGGWWDKTPRVTNL